MDVSGNILESMEIKEILQYLEWYSNGQKRWENKTIDGKSVFVNRWREDGMKRKEPFKWEKDHLKMTIQILKRKGLYIIL